MKTVFNQLKVDYTKQPIFFGEDLGLQRYDRVKLPIFLKLFKDQLEFFWRPEEISLVKDKGDFLNLNDIEKFVFTSNLAYQTAMDSVIGRGINLISKHVSLPEVEACFNVWQMFETLHSFSYTYIIQNVFPDSKEFFDSIIENKEIIKRAQSITERYDALIGKPKDEYQAVYLSLISTNILESLRFYVSFACGFFFGEQGKMVGNASILKLISRDENLHVSITQDLLKILRDNKEEGFQETIKENKDLAVELYKSAVEEEKDWANYLFSKGALIGLNEKTLSGYIEWLAERRMRSLGLPQIYDVKSSPLGGWLNNWSDSQRTQVAPQETEILNYKIKASINDINEADLGSL